MHKEIENALSSQDLDYLLKKFNHNLPHNSRYTQKMLKVDFLHNDQEFCDFIHNIIKNKLHIKKEQYTIVGDNFYKHNNSYFPHCDAREKNAWLNIVIPIKLWQTFGQQKFIVYDQYWRGKNATWIGNLRPIPKFESNHGLTQKPSSYEQEFENNTFMPLPETLWQCMNTKYFDKDYFFGMSGYAYNWSPGNIILFDSAHIHQTGKMQCLAKLGLSVRITKND